MTATATSVRPARNARARLWLVPVLAALVVAVLAVSLVTDTPTRRTIRVQNPTDASVTVYASGEGRDGWLGLGTVDPHDTSTFEAVSDRGSVWRFRLSSGPDQLGVIQRGADQLRADGWKLVIPASAAARVAEIPAG